MKNIHESSPYLEKIDTRGRLTIWLVDGAHIRSTIDEEFTNFGQHYRYSYIPKDELWIDREADMNERNFFIEHLLVEHRLMEKGMAYSEAIVEADNAERRVRRQSGLVKVATRTDTSLPDLKQARTRLWKTLESGVSVWIVDGNYVRSVFDIDFTAGGHDHVYEFVPDNEVWIDDDIVEDERPYVLLHELHERNKMGAGAPYSEAHASASRLEYHHRHHPDELHDALASEGWA